MAAHDFTIYDFICRSAQIYSQRTSFVYKNTRIDYGQFKKKCDRLADGLIKAGIEKGDRLGILAYNCLDYMVLFGAAAKIGAIMLPINWRLQKDEVTYILNDCTPKIIFAGPDFQGLMKEISYHLEFIKKCYTVDTTDKVDGFLNFEDLYSEEIGREVFDISADTGFLIIHTAAASGRPRGALLSQANIVYANLDMISNFQLSPDDCNIGILPFSHIAGLIMTAVLLHAGGKNVILEKFDPELACRLIDREKGTIFFDFAPILQMIMDRFREGKYNFSSLRHVAGLNSAENINNFLKRVPQAKYWTGYGQTEAMWISSCRFDERPGCAGKPSKLARLALFDDYEREVPTGKSGEICIRSPIVFLGYWNLPLDNEYTFRNGWHHTGDIGRFDEDGYLWYQKRKAEKELIKSGGENVYPAEVEKAILEHEAVFETCVFGVPDPDWGEAIKSICVLSPGKSIEPQEIIDFVATKIARYKKPKYLVILDSLPHNDTGEIDREQVKKDHGANY